MGKSLIVENELLSIEQYVAESCMTNELEWLEKERVIQEKTLCGDHALATMHRNVLNAQREIGEMEQGISFG